VSSIDWLALGGIVCVLIGAMAATVRIAMQVLRDIRK